MGSARCLQSWVESRRAQVGKGEIGERAGWGEEERVKEEFFQLAFSFQLGNRYKEKFYSTSGTKK